MKMYHGNTSQKNVGVAIIISNTAEILEEEKLT